MNDRGLTSSAIYELIRDRLLAGVYPPNSALRENDLANDLHCSRTPIREALRRLASEGLVVLVPNKGARVAEWMETDIIQIFALRANLEGYAARRAAKARSLEAIDEMRMACDAMEAEAASGSEARFDEITALNNRFHACILSSSGDKRLMAMVANIVQVGLVRHTFRRYSTSELARSMNHHRELIAAFEHQDADWAESVMRCHIFAARAALSARNVQAEVDEELG